MNIRGEIDNQLDQIEDAVNRILSNLEGVKNEAQYDIEALSEGNIMDLQGEILDAIDDLERLLDELS